VRGNKKLSIVSDGVQTDDSVRLKFFVVVQSTIIQDSGRFCQKYCQFVQIEKNNLDKFGGNDFLK